jgi:hypothetical protein
MAVVSASSTARFRGRGSAVARTARKKHNHEPASAQANGIAIDHCVTSKTGNSEKTENVLSNMLAKDSQTFVSRGTKINDGRVESAR